MKTDFTKTLRKDRKELGEMLWRLALRAADEELTFKAIAEAVAGMTRRRRKVRGSAGREEIARHVRETARTLAEARRVRGRRAGTAALDRCRLPLEVRLADRTANEVSARARSLFRNGAAGGGSIRVALVGDPERIGYDVELGTNREVYRGAFKGWAARVDRHVIRVGRDWLRRVGRPGLAVVDGALTLFAVPCAQEATDAELFEARRGRQGRGYSVVVEEGFIARDPELGLVAWGASKRATLQALRRRREVAETLMRDTGLDRTWAARHGRLRVTRADAGVVAACREGTEDWLRRAGLAHLRSASLVRVHAAWLQHPEDHARRAMRLVARRAGAETAACSGDPSERETTAPEPQRPALNDTPPELHGPKLDGRPVQSAHSTFALPH